MSSNTKVVRFFFKLPAVKTLTYTAVFTALCTLANIFTIPMAEAYGTALSFTYICCFLSAIYLGLVPALTVAALGDLLGCILSPKGAFNPIILLASALLGVIPALVFMLPRLNKYVKLVIAIVLCGVICTSGLNTFAMWWFFSSKSKTFWAYLAIRAPFQLIMLAVNGVICFLLLKTKALDRVFTAAAQEDSDQEQLNGNSQNQ